MIWRGATDMDFNGRCVTQYARSMLDVMGCLARCARPERRCLPRSRLGLPACRLRRHAMVLAALGVFSTSSRREWREAARATWVRAAAGTNITCRFVLRRHFTTAAVLAEAASSSDMVLVAGAENATRAN